MKRLGLLMLLVLCLLGMAVAEEPTAGVCGGYRYRLLPDGTAQIRSYDGGEEVLTVPDMLDGVPVTAIGDRAFNFCSALTCVILPDSVTAIGVNPFKDCRNLREICVSPENPALEVVDGVLFSKADRRLVCYPNGLTETAYSVPEGTEVIGDEAFYGCFSLGCITLPDSVTTVHGSSFLYCANLMDIRVSPEHPKWTVVDGVLFSKADRRLVCYPDGLKATSYVVPEGVEIIGDGAFRAARLRRITLPASVTAIGADAFRECWSLEEVNLSEGLEIIGENAFWQCSALRSIILPDSVTIIGNAAFSDCVFLMDVKLPAGLTMLGRSVFSHCYALQEVVLPQSVTAIGDYAFFWCPALSCVILPENLTAIGACAFVRCTSLREVVLPQSITVIGESAFAQCTSLREVVLPQSVTAIGERTFAQCRFLRRVTLHENVTAIGEEAFDGCRYLTLVLPSGSYAERYARDNAIPYVFADISDEQPD